MDSRLLGNDKGLIRPASLATFSQKDKGEPYERAALTSVGSGR
jgi:hypothetical protein